MDELYLFSERVSRSGGSFSWTINPSPALREKLIGLFSGATGLKHPHHLPIGLRLNEMIDALMRHYGVQHDHVYSYDEFGNRYGVSYTDFVRLTHYPQLVDLIELFLLHLKVYGDNTRIVVESQVNRLFKRERCPIRFIDCYTIILNDEYLQYEIYEETQKLLASLGFDRANEHFASAYQNYNAGDFRGCISEAFSCWESTAKRLLKSDRIDGSRVVHELIDSRKIEKYYPTIGQDLTTILTALTRMAHTLGRHGQAEHQQTISPNQEMASYVMGTLGSLVRLSVASAAQTAERSQSKTFPPAAPEAPEPM
jgi:hypothetical protein